MKKVTLHSTKDVDDLLKVIRDRTDEYHAIYLKRPSQWVSSIREKRFRRGCFQAGFHRTKKEFNTPNNLSEIL